MSINVIDWIGSAKMIKRVINNIREEIITYVSSKDLAR